jgi:outer membrane protein assembly factor BamE (lipoprotein component of BamABCDE complex)
MREIIPEPYKKPEPEATSSRLTVVVVSLVLLGSLGFAWNKQHQKELKAKARYYSSNGTQRLKSSWARLQIGQSEEEVESLLGTPAKKYRTCWYYTSAQKDYVDYDSSDPQVHFDNNLRVRGWVAPR